MSIGTYVPGNIVWRCYGDKPTLLAPLVSLQSPGSDVDRQVGEAAAVAPLVIVPGQYLDHVPADDHGAGGVDYRAVGIAFKIHAHQLLLAVFQDALELAGGGFLERLVDLLDGHVFLCVADEVDDGDSGGGDAQRNAVDFTFQSGH